MNSISNTILQNYVSHLADLPESERLHFLSRLTRWSDTSKLEQQFTELVGGLKPASDEAAEAILKKLVNGEDTDQPVVIDQAIRLPYFEKYPALRGLNDALFQVHNWLTNTGYDARPLLNEIIPSADQEELSNRLQVDIPALLALSTYAVNYVYRVHRLMLADEQVLFTVTDLQNFQPYIADGSITLLIYFVTHCVIAETLFYTRPLPVGNQKAYLAMLQFVEPLLVEQRKKVSLDAQLEFIVACRLCNYNSPAEPAIMAQAQEQFDPDKGILVDPLRPGKNELITAEHRNVIFLLTQLPCKLVRS